EERWFYEAVTECYIPLIHVFESLVNDGVDFRITMSITPTLMSMFTDELLQNRYSAHITKLIELAEKETERTKWEPHFHKLAHMYKNNFIEASRTFHDRYQKNLLNAFKKFQDLGVLEVITCGATHGYLPLVGVHRESVRAQIGSAVDLYTKLMVRKPKGIWLPECAFNEGDDTILDEFGIKYFFVDTHGIMYADTRPKYGIYAPLYCPSGVAAFGRDTETSKQVWSSQEGYPGDFDYREYYRDIGWDLDYDYIKPYIHPNGLRINTGIKYHKITGKTDDKQPYDPHAGFNKSAHHAGNFMFNREKQVEFLSEMFDRKPLIVSPYDAELFGHWWYEGPSFLNYLCRKIAYDQDTIKLITPSEYLAEYPVNQMTVPSSSSWGLKGYHEVWLEGSNDWIYRHIHKASERMTELASMFPYASGDLLRALKQAARELLLAQSSDWAFIMKTGTMVDYAMRKTKLHLHRFTGLYEDIKWNKINPSWLTELEYMDNIFPDIDYKYYLPYNPTSSKVAVNL
ncbi:MAG TPA: 1,4-alpha-glucan branching protein domain-containing protein, partial [Desulfobacteria bacterium]|nr:1,4-alpha-glucan branching protein domain-containing protein [Desulfobacteria bacterium]